jgi:predicted MFS family arabinose efflux permease
MNGSDTSQVSEAQPDRWIVLLVLTLAYTMNIADRFVVSTLIEPIKAEFALSDASVGLLTGAALALFYVTAGIPLGVLADRTNRKRMIVAALTIWSALTAICGLAQNFWQLLVARIGVGIGEAGGTPPSQSLLSDKFLPQSRSMAMSLFAVGAAAGAALGSSLGGWINDGYGWRAVFIAFGLLGLPVALLVLFCVKEPRRGGLDDAAPATAVSFRDTLRFIAGQRALLHILAGCTVITYWGWGLVWWTPAFLTRSHGMSVAVSGNELGTMHAVGGIGVTLLTAWVMRLMARRDPREQCWFITITTLAATIPSIAAYWLNSTSAALLALWLFVPIIYLYIGPTLALAQNLVPPAMRSQISAIVVFVANVANLAIAPLLIGALSDMVAPHLNDQSQSLRYVLAGSALTGLWAAYHYWAAASSLKAGLSRAGFEVHDDEGQRA